MKRLLFVMMFILASCCLFAAAVPVAPLWTGLVDNNGQPLSSGLVYFYAAGTGTAKTVWHDSGKASAWTQPVVLDAYGRAQVFADGVYKLIVADSASNTLITFDGATYLDPSAATTSTFVTITATNGTIGSFTSTGATLSSATISASTFTNGNINGSALTSVTLASPTINNANLANASVSTDLNMNLHKITNLATPTALTDGVNKGYMDTVAVAGVPISGPFDTTDSFSTTALASAATWSSAQGIGTIVNTSGADRYYLICAHGSVELVGTLADASAYSSNSTLGILDGSGNVYAETIAQNYITHSVSAASSTWSINNRIPWSIFGTVKVAAGATVVLSLQHKSVFGATGAANLLLAPSNKWFTIWRVQ